MSPITWDEKFMTMAYLAAMKSKDESTHVGAVIVGPSNEIRTTGFNSFPRGLNDDIPERQRRPDKNFWIEHAERNAIYNCARMGLSTDGCSIYIAMFPCAACARAIIQAGIVEVIVHQSLDKSADMSHWDEDFIHSETMMKEVGIKIRWYDGPILQIVGLRGGKPLDLTMERPESKDALRKETKE